jgi:hypothetical protein
MKSDTIDVYSVGRFAGYANFLALRVLGFRCASPQALCVSAASRAYASQTCEAGNSVKLALIGTGFKSTKDAYRCLLLNCRMLLPRVPNMILHIPKMILVVRIPL